MKRTAAALAFVLGILAASGSARAAASCPGVTLQDGPQPPAVMAAVGRQISDGALPIDLTLTSGSWRIYHVRPKTADPLYMFFHGDPARTSRIYLSPGLGRPDEYADIKMEVEQNATGIPPALSACFARLVTGAK